MTPVVFFTFKERNSNDTKKYDEEDKECDNISKESQRFQQRINQSL